MIYRNASCDFTVECDIDLALTYALRRPRLALAILNECYARLSHRPDLAYRVRDLASLIAP